MSRDNRNIDVHRKPTLAGTLFFLLFGPLIWAAHFTLSYGSHTLMCRLGTPADTAALFVIVATVAALAVLSFFLIKPRIFSRLLGVSPKNDQALSINAIAMLLAGLSIVAVLWGGATVSFITACVQGR